MKRIFKALNQARVKYMLAGGIAVNLYGIDRDVLIARKKGTGRPEEGQMSFTSVRSPKSGKMKNSPLLYYKNREDINSYRKKPVKTKLRWLEAQMEFFHKAMPEKAKRIRKKLDG